MFTQSAIRWGIIIGLVNMAWLYGSFYMGMHTHGIRSMQSVTVVAAVLNVVAYVVALGMETRRIGPMPYGKGFKFGFGTTLINAVMAAVAQIGYFKVIHPEWPSFMVGQSRRYFEEQKLSPEKIESLVAQSAAYFRLESYMLQAVISTLLIGTVLSAALMLILRRKRRG